MHGVILSIHSMLNINNKKNIIEENRITIPKWAPIYITLDTGAHKCMRMSYFMHVHNLA